MARDLCEYPNIEGGYVMLARKVAYSSLFTLPANDFKVAAACMVMANHQEGRWWDDLAQEEVLIPRGSFISSVRKIAGLTKLSEKVVRNALRRLEKVNFLHRNVVKRAQDRAHPPGGNRAQVWAHRYSLITLIKYDFYNDPTNYSRAQKEAQPPTPDRAQKRAQLGQVPRQVPGQSNNNIRREESKETPPDAVSPEVTDADRQLVRRFYGGQGCLVLDSLVEKGAKTAAELRRGFEQRGLPPQELERVVDEVAGHPDRYRRDGQRPLEHFGGLPYVVEQALKQLNRPPPAPSVTAGVIPDAVQKARDDDAAWMERFNALPDAERQVRLIQARSALRAQRLSDALVEAMAPGRAMVDWRADVESAASATPSG